MKKKNIAILCPCLTNGGAERAAANLSKHLSDCANVYIILFYNRPITYEYSGKIIQLHFDEWYNKHKNNIIGKSVSRLSYIRTIKELKQIKKKYNIDACISFLDLLNVYNILSKTKEDVYVSVRNNRSMQNNTSFDKIINWFVKHFYKKAKKVISLSYGVTDDLAKNFGIPRDDIVTIYNYFDIAEMTSKAEKELPQSICSLIEGKKIILGMGRFVEQKNFLNLINVCAPILKENDDLMLIILGRGTLQDKMISLIERHQLNDRIKIVDYLENPMPLIKQASLFVMNSKFEGLCNSIVESMVCGTLTISRDCKYGPREMIAGITEYDSSINKFEIYDRGILVPMDNDEEMDSAIRYSLSHTEILKKQTKNAKEFFSTDFNNQVDKCWKQLLGVDNT